MLVFPQLTTGATGQFPLVRRRSRRSVQNFLNDGSTVNYSDGSPRSNDWELSLRDLTDAEANAIQTLFQSVEGRRGAFTFLDPAANLIADSEDFSSSRWTNGPLIQITAGVADPLGGARAARLINAGQSSQALAQTLPAPGWFVFSLSVYGRSLSGGPISLTRSSASATHTRVFDLGDRWTRCVLSGALNTVGESVSFSVELPAGASVELFGFQVEAQPFASAYKRTINRNGVYSNARFDSDTLDFIDDGPDQHRFDLRIVAKD